MAGLERFVEAQSGGTYETALAELRDGNKRSHWMWFIFPQIAGLGRSPTAQFYAIAGREEALGYLAHERLGSRLRECTLAMLRWSGRLSAEDILGQTDAMKLRSSMTLFEAAGQRDDLFRQLIDAFYEGVRDGVTLRLL